jgi:senataxin
MSLPEFADVLRCFVFLLRRLGADFWSKESSDYPQVIFDAIKDNSSFADLTRDPGWKSNEPWLLIWFSNYLHSIWTWQTFDDVLVRMIDFLCEELQHERFQEARPASMIAATDVCLSPYIIVDLRIYLTSATSHRSLQIREQDRLYPTLSCSSFARHSR